MNIKKLSVVLVLLLSVSLLLPVATSFAFSSSGNGNNDEPGNNLDLNMLEVGDIVLVSGGYGIIPVGGDWDHAIIYAGNGKVVEAVADGGVRKTDATVIHKSDEAGVFRVDAPNHIKQSALEFAKNQVGDRYSFRWLRWPGGKNTHSNSWYCTELAWAAYKNNGIDINGNPGYHWRFWNNVSGTCIADSGKTEMVAYAD